MLFNSYSYEILYEWFHWIYLQGDIKLLLVTVNNRLTFEIEIIHHLSCYPILHNAANPAAIEVRQQSMAAPNGTLWDLANNIYYSAGYE